LHVTKSDQEAAVTHPRNLIILGKNSQGTFVESYRSIEEGSYFTNSVTEIVLGENAVADHCKVQGESRKAFHVATVQVFQDRNSSFTSHSVSSGSALARQDLNVILDGEGADCTLNGLYLVEDRQHVDHHTKVDHVRPHGSSRELYKGILAGRSTGVFNGKIAVWKDAQKTDAKQNNQNLLLSEDAEINSKPQLEILADDVKCTHGTAIGQIDRDVLFYLRTRGIGEGAARSLLTYGFAFDALARIKVEAVRYWLESEILSQLQSGEEIRETL
jgi:Fe-S cluster assembly protein SufD